MVGSEELGGLNPPNPPSIRTLGKFEPPQLPNLEWLISHARIRFQKCNRLKVHLAHVSLSEFQFSHSRRARPEIYLDWAYSLKHLISDQ